MLRQLLLATCLLPTASLADCPTAGDLGKGIRFTLESGDKEVFVRFNENTIASHFFAGDKEITRVLLAQGLYLTEVIDVHDGALDPASRVTYTFPGSLADLPLPVAGGQFSAEVVVNDGRLTKETEIYQFGQETRIQYGPCGYAMIPVEIRYRPDDTNVDLLHWLPELGLSYLAGSTTPDGEDKFIYTAIEVMP